MEHPERKGEAESRKEKVRSSRGSAASQLCIRGSGWAGVRSGKMCPRALRRDAKWPECSCWSGKSWKRIVCPELGSEDV